MQTRLTIDGDFFVIVGTIGYILLVGERFFCCLTNRSFERKRKYCGIFFFTHISARTRENRSFWHIHSHKRLVFSFSLNKSHFMLLLCIGQAKSRHILFEKELIVTRIGMMMSQMRCRLVFTAPNQLRLYL